MNVGTPDSLSFCHALLDERDVVAVPGSIFSRGLEGWLRTSFVGALDDIREGFGRIAAMAALPIAT
jgi:aspartate/methionine/tyrosine aminotransferase